MADDCISVYFETTDTFWNYCWEDSTPDPTWNPLDVITGLRRSQGTTQRSWRTCQYYMKGLPAICVWWKEGSPDDEEGTTTSGQYYCSYVKDNTSDNPQDPLPDEPTGFNYTQCDFLGRRQWCDKYEKSVPDDPEEWLCTAPNPYLTGLGLKSVDSENATFEPVPRDDVWGYNDANDGTGKGLCDCHGMGRGAAGCALTVPAQDSPSDYQSAIEKELSERTIVCNYYRPYQMGFGIIQPSIKNEGDVLPDGTITEQGWINAQAWEDDVEYRRPLNYEMYNHRARFQKCQWWDEDTGRTYEVDNQGFLYLNGAPDIFDDTGKVEFCVNPDDKVIPYNTRIFEEATASGGVWEFTGAQFALDGLWAGAGGPVCNGCRPDCPGYSGRWVYITNDKMLPGMPVTANQVLELRFWSNEWDSKEDYDKYYEHKPNFDDARTSALFTFTKWKHLDPVESDRSIMLGKRLDLCLPAPINNREFTLDYVQEEDIQYSSITTYGNSTGTNAPGQYHFPSLVRNPQFTELNPLTVLYPYYNDDIFDAEICTNRGPAGHIKRHNTIYGDSIKTIGYTLSDKKVYVINTTIVPIDAVLRNYTGAYRVNNTTLKYNLFRYITDMIELAKDEYPDYIVEAASNETNGLFITEAVKLKYEASNNLLICVDYDDGTWEWRWRKVNSLWYGGILKQNTYEHLYENSDTGYTNEQPTSMTSTTNVSISAEALGHSSSSDLLSSYSFNDNSTGITYYSWHMKWSHSEDIEQENWAPIGNSNMILVEVDDANLNYVYDWEIESAYLEAKTETDEEGNETKVGGEHIPDIVELEVYSGVQDDDALPPSFCILRPIEDIRYRFFNTVWTLYVSYKYKTFENGNPQSVPEDDLVAGAGSTSSSFYSTSPYTLNIGGLIQNITKGPVALLGQFYDENNRVIATNATKALVNIVRESCRSVEIKYEYYTQADEWVLEPSWGFCINIASKQKTGERRKIKEIPDCGDHEGSFPTKWIAPMWFPYDSCRGYDLYDEWTICNRCQSGYVGPDNAGVYRDEEGNIDLVGGTALRRNDFRYCGPHKYKAYGAVRSAKPTPCNCSCVFYYVDARAADVQFSGFARKRESIDEFEWRSRGWHLPPYGNEGRELIEKYLSSDYEQHIQRQQQSINIKTSWMPLVMDNAMFYFPDFDCFSTNTPDDEYYYISASPTREPFKYTNQLNYITADFLAENLLDNRYRFDDIFEVHHEGNCTYPKPTYVIGGTTKVVLYHFKNSDYAWAWQEHWKDIERSPDEVDPLDFTSTTRFRFIEIERPKYRWSAYKEEHRFITSEGAHVLVYTPPELDDEGNITDLPKISLDGAHPRPFEIIYPEGSYDSTQVTWKNVGGEAVVDGSSDVDNIYEKTNQGDWVHDINTLFDTTAVSGTENANQIITSIDGFTGDETINYYNRGIIAHITRKRLYYLPKYYYDMFYINETGSLGIFESLDYSISVNHDAMYEGEESLPGEFVWDKDSISIVPYNFDDTISIYKLYIKGFWGSTIALDGQNYNKIVWPAVSLTATFIDDSTGMPSSLNSAQSEYIIPDGEIEDGNLEEYIIELKFLLGPLDLIGNKKIKDFSINITGSNNYFICIKEIKLTTAELKTLNNSPEQIENITIWERKYKVSTMLGITHNLDGPGDYIKYDLHNNNSGQYFPWTGAEFGNEEFYSSTAQSKMRSVSCGLRYTEPENVTITYETLHDVELEEQRDTYKFAGDERDTLGDDLNFSGFEMPKLYDALLENGINLANLSGLYMYSEKLPWELHTLTKQFEQYEYWRPGGHSYEWSQYWKRDKCTIFGTPQVIFEGDFRHYDHPYGNPIVADTATDIINSYYNLRFETMVAKAKRAEILGGGGSVPNDLVSAANPFNQTGFR